MSEQQCATRCPWHWNQPEHAALSLGRQAIDFPQNERRRTRNTNSWKSNSKLSVISKTYRTSLRTRSGRSALHQCLRQTTCRRRLRQRRWRDLETRFPRVCLDRTRIKFWICFRRRLIFQTLTRTAEGKLCWWGNKKKLDRRFQSKCLDFLQTWKITLPSISKINGALYLHVFREEAPDFFLDVSSDVLVLEYSAVGKVSTGQVGRTFVPALVATRRTGHFGIAFCGCTNENFCKNGIKLSRVKRKENNFNCS